MKKGSKNTEPSASIVLLNFNGIRFVKDCMSSVFTQNYPSYEVILVDNGSSDGSVELLQGFAEGYPNIPFRIIKNGRNLGYSVPNNLGVEISRGDYVILLSNDVRVGENWLASMIKVMEARGDIAVAQSQMYSLYSPDVPDPQGNCLDVLGLSHRFIPSPIVKEVFYSEGACMFIKREALTKAGGLFDPDYVMFDEDIDFCWRVRLMGYKVCVVPSSKAYHARGGTVSGVLIKTNPFFVFTNTRNQLVTMYKNYEITNLLKFLPLTLGYETLKAIWLITNRQRRAGTGCLKGIIAFLSDLPKTQSKRLIVQRSRCVDDDVIRAQMLPLREAVRSFASHAMEITRQWRRGTNSL